jgi:hypothetical protein
VRAIRHAILLGVLAVGCGWAVSPAAAAPEMPPDLKKIYDLYAAGKTAEARVAVIAKVDDMIRLLDAETKPVEYESLNAAHARALVGFSAAHGMIEEFLGRDQKAGGGKLSPALVDLCARTVATMERYLTLAPQLAGKSESALEYLGSAQTRQAEFIPKVATFLRDAGQPKEADEFTAQCQKILKESGAWPVLVGKVNERIAYGDDLAKKENPGPETVREMLGFGRYLEMIRGQMDLACSGKGKVSADMLALCTRAAAAMDRYIGRAQAAGGNAEVVREMVRAERFGLSAFIGRVIVTLRAADQGKEADELARAHQGLLDACPPPDLAPLPVKSVPSK